MEFREASDLRGKCSFRFILFVPGIIIRKITRNQTQVAPGTSPCLSQFFMFPHPPSDIVQHNELSLSAMKIYLSPWNSFCQQFIQQLINELETIASLRFKSSLSVVINSFAINNFTDKNSAKLDTLCMMLKIKLLRKVDLNMNEKNLHSMKSRHWLNCKHFIGLQTVLAESSFGSFSLQTFNKMCSRWVFGASSAALREEHELTVKVC